MNNMTYEELVQAMLAKVKNDVDKREGSIIFDAIAPCAFFLSQMGFQLDNFLDLVLPDTAVGEYLDRAVAGWGIVRRPASAAVRKMQTSGAVPIGSKWGIQELTYTVESQISTNSYQVVCDFPGENGNLYSGTMQPITNGISGISATLGEVLVPGAEIEGDESLRERFYTQARLPVTSGNANQYRQWAMEVPGTGAAKVIPLGNGVGTVVVLVVDDKKEISPALPAKVQTHIDAVRPIGATVAVISPNSLSVSVSANVMLDKTRTIQEVKKDFEEALAAFLKNSIFSSYRVSMAKVGNLLLDIPGVEDFDQLKLNGLSSNVSIGERQIPVKGAVNLQEVSSIATE